MKRVSFHEFIIPYIASILVPEEFWELFTIGGISPRDVEKVRAHAWKLLRTDRFSTIKICYEFCVYFNEAVEGVNPYLPTLLQENSNGNQLSNERLADYSLCPLRVNTRSPRGYAEEWYGKVIREKLYSLYLDCPTGITLMYKGKPNAIVGLYPCNESTLMIYQLQGVRPINIETGERASSRGIAPLDWQKLLVDIAVYIGNNMGFSTIGILGASNNPWVRLGHFTLEDAVEKYDNVATRLGFKPRSDGNFYMSIEEYIEKHHKNCHKNDWVKIK